MPTLHIDLRDGWNDDQVSIVVDGREVFNRTVRTLRLTGLAERVEVETAGGERQVEVSVPGRGVRERIPVPVAGPTFLGLSITPAGEIRSRVSAEEFGYG